MSESELLTDLIKAAQKYLIASDRAHTCINCVNWHGTTELCDKYKARPPAPTIVYGCKDWQPDIPF